jgi:hypothetical protein
MRAGRDRLCETHTDFEQQEFLLFKAALHKNKIVANFGVVVSCWCIKFDFVFERYSQVPVFGIFRIPQSQSTNEGGQNPTPSNIW